MLTFRQKRIKTKQLAAECLLCVCYTTRTNSVWEACIFCLRSWCVE